MMLAKITLLTSLLFAVLYPLCFWISFKDPLKNNFHKFHIGLPNVIGGIVLVSILLMDLPLALKMTVLVWKLTLLSVSSYSWKKEYPRAQLMSLPCLIGIFAFAQVYATLIDFNLDQIIVSILAGLILCSSLFAMNLGHWYLNVHGLPIQHLENAVKVFGFFLVLRFFWDMLFLFQGNILYQGENITYLLFLTRMDGFLLSLGLFFGTVFPLASLYFVNGTLKLKNTQAATGILYVILCSVLIGDLAYKYYLFKYGIAL